MQTEMTAEDVAAFYRAMAERGIAIWMIGGWGVDALLCRQTRRHADLDILLLEDDCQAVVDYLKARGYADVPRDDTRPCNFVMGDGMGREIDFHVIRYDDDGNGLYGRPLEATFPAEALRAFGRIGDVSVRCLSAEFQMECHTGYEFDEDDIHDVLSLAHAFDLDPPEAYRSLAVQSS